MAEPSATSNQNPETEFLLGRLLVVPLIIVSVIILCTVVVVLSFGAIASEKQKPIARVLAVLEAGTGDKTGGLLLMPQDKETWQAAQELALRLENLEDEVPPEQLPEIRGRLVGLLEQALGQHGHLERRGRQRTFFIMRAAAKAGAVDAVPLMVGALESADSEVRREALASLALMADEAPARRHMARIAEMLKDPEPVVRMLACVALSSLGNSADMLTIAALADAHLTDEEQDVRWNAALALARLGSSQALPTIADMLQRDYWQKQRVQYQTPSGAVVDRPLTPNRVDEHLIAAIDAAAALDDIEVWNSIEGLAGDRALRVVARARQAQADRQSDAEPE